MYLIEPIRNGTWIYDPGIAMALQDYIKNHVFLDDDIMFPHITRPAVQIGKFQNAYEEVNQPYMDKHDIKLVRRETGGGAIYRDESNVGLCFLLDDNHEIFGNYARLYEPAIKALKKLGVDHVSQKGRNDLILDGKKISGAAMTIQNKRIYAGYSLLLYADYDAIVYVLNAIQKKIESHDIQSVRSRVGAIRPYLAPEHQKMTVWDFTNYMICQLLEINHVSEAKRYKLTAEDWANIDTIAKEKYNNWDWNYGRFHQFEYRLTERFPIGTITIDMQIEHAKISAIQITGDFFGKRDVKEIEDILSGTRLKEEALLNVLESVNLTNYFGKLSKEDLVHFILSDKA